MRKLDGKSLFGKFDKLLESSKFTKEEKEFLKKRLRPEKELAEDNMAGSLLINDVTMQTALDFRTISMDYFAWRDGPALAALVQMFKVLVQRDPKTAEAIKKSLKGKKEEK